MNSELNFANHLEELVARLNKVIAALPNTSEDVLLADQIQYANRRLQTHGQKPLTSPRQLTLIIHDLAAVGYWLATLTNKEIFSSYRLAPLQQTINQLVGDLNMALQAAKRPSILSADAATPPSQPTIPPPAPAIKQPPPPENWQPEDDTSLSNSDCSKQKRPPSTTKIEYQKHTYTWTGATWYDENYLKPSQVILRTLNQRLDSALVEEDHKVTNIHELIDRARKARDTAQYSRAERLSRRILELEPDNHAGAAMLCAALRARHRPRQALEETDRFAHSGNPALLTSRAAACCDLGLWEEARRYVGQSLAIVESEEAFMVVKRIKSEHPELYRK